LFGLVWVWLVGVWWWGLILVRLGFEG